MRRISTFQIQNGTKRYKTVQNLQNKNKVQQIITTMSLEIFGSCKKQRDPRLSANTMSMRFQPETAMSARLRRLKMRQICDENIFIKNSKKPNRHFYKSNFNSP